MQVPDRDAWRWISAAPRTEKPSEEMEYVPRHGTQDAVSHEHVVREIEKEYKP